MSKKSITREIDELRTMPVPDLVARYAQEFGKPPRVKHREYLWKRIAHMVQTKKYGGLSMIAKRRLEELIAEIDLPLDENKRTVTGRLKDRTRPDGLKVGSVLSRTWRDKEIRVVVQEGGLVWEGTVYRSLSAVARAITGTKWNGKLYFGLTKRKRSR